MRFLTWADARHVGFRRTIRARKMDGEGLLCGGCETVSAMLGSCSDRLAVCKSCSVQKLFCVGASLCEGFLCVKAV